MNTIQLINTALCAATLACLGCNQEAVPPQNTITLTNDFFLGRINEPVIITRDSLAAMFPAADLSKVPVLTSATGTPVPGQVDDLNGDGQWDEWIFVLDSIAKESSLTLNVAFVAAQDVPTYKDRTAVRMGKDTTRQKNYVNVTEEIRPANHEPMVYPCIYQSEGPIWESEKVAFRNYFDRRNGMDIFGKTKDIMIADSVGVHSDYHKLQNWGLDLLKVGNSLGAGAIALYDNDSLWRLGDTKSAVYRLVNDGPVRSTFNLEYEGWQVNGKTLSVTQQFSIIAGQYYYANKVQINGLTGNERLAIGITNLKSDKKVYQTFSNPGYKFFATHCVQSDNYGPEKERTVGDILGMAVLHPSKGFAGYDRTRDQAITEGEVVSTEYVKLWLKDGEPITYRFFAGWEQSDDRFKTKDGFLRYLQEMADRFHRPVKVTAGISK